MVFCELLVVASQMPDSEKHVKNLLDNFANQWVFHFFFNFNS